MEQISMMELKNRITQLGKSEIVLDVREPDEYSEGHVPGSRNIPLAGVENFVKELSKYDRVYVHCHAGRRAQMAAQTLARAGLTNLVCVSGGGMGDWIASGFPVER